MSLLTQKRHLDRSIEQAKRAAAENAAALRIVTDLILMHIKRDPNETKVECVRYMLCFQPSRLVIRFVRDLYGCSLKEARQFVDGVREGRERLVAP